VLTPLLVTLLAAGPARSHPASADSAAAPPPAPADSIGIERLPEVPLDAPDEADVTFERAPADSAAGVEVGFGWSGSGSAAPRRARSVRFAGDGLDGVVREGGDDPLAGAEVGGRTVAGAWRVGRSAPQWGCGWLVGAPRAPWGEAGVGGSAGLRTGPRGDVATLALGAEPRLEALVGRFARRSVAALRAEVGGRGVLVAATPHGIAGAGLFAAGDDLAGELVFDRAGRWRGELVAARASPAGRLALRARGGSAAFRPLLAPARGGPAQGIAADWTLAGARIQPRAGASLWRFAPGVTGARGRLEVDLRLAHHAAWTLGVEEQRGTRREGSATRGLRQGWWAEWRGSSGPLGLTLGLENWGRRSRARDPVRRASLAAVQCRLPFGGWVRAEQRAFRAGAGEGYRAADFEADRVVLRSLSGAGERTRIELMVPGPAGRMRAGLTLNAAASRPARTQWTLDWTRRARIGGRGP